MKISSSIQQTNTGSTMICKNCAHFQNDPSFIEETYPGLTTMSSGFASVRDQDGLCNHHQLYLSSVDSCKNFTQRMPEI
jgi:hypothetical protein